MRKTVALGVALIAGMLAGACTRIEPGHVGIKISNAGSTRGVDRDALTTGWVFYMPGASTVYEYPTYVQQVVLTRNTNEGSSQNDEISFTNSDQMTIYADISFAYHLEADKVPAFYEKFRSDDLNNFTHGYLKSLIRDKFNEVGGKYSIDKIMGDNGPFLLAVRESVQREVMNIGVVMEPQFGFIGAPRPPASVINAINVKAQAAQIAIQKQMELAQAQADANKAVAEAEGQAKSKVARANADAQTITLLADAQAQANQKLSASLTPLIVEYKKMDRWNGVLPTVSGATPFIQIKNNDKD